MVSISFDAPPHGMPAEVFFMLTIKDLTIIHQKDLRELVRGLSFTVSGRDRLAVIGEEGNGKSTLLKLIYAPETALAYCAYTGVISCPGERLGYLPQEIPPEKRELPVYAFCAENEAFLETDPREMNALCAQLQLPSDLCYSDQPVSSLSGGEKVKLQLLLLLCAHPSMLLLDEPSNDLDLRGLSHP